MWAITKLTFCRAKDSALILLLIMGGIVAFFLRGTDIVKVFGENSNALDPVTATTGVFMGTAILTGVAILITLFNATSEIPRDINGRLISVLLSKPLSRFQYVMGKFLGTLGISFSFGFFWVTVMLIGRSFLPDPAVSRMGFWEVIAQYNCLLALVPTCAFATAVSCFFSDMVSMIIASAYIFISAGMAIGPILASLSGTIFGKLVLFIYLFFPNYLYFLQNQPGLVGSLGCITYSISISLIFIIVGVARFNQGDIFSRD
jgi:hypothetical protein